MGSLLYPYRDRLFVTGWSDPVQSRSGRARNGPQAGFRAGFWATSFLYISSSSSKVVLNGAYMVVQNTMLNRRLFDATTRVLDYKQGEYNLSIVVYCDFNPAATSIIFCLCILQSKQLHHLCGYRAAEHIYPTTCAFYFPLARSSTLLHNTTRRGRSYISLNSAGPFCGARVLVANAATNSSSLPFALRLKMSLARKTASFARAHRSKASDAHRIISVTSTTPSNNLQYVRPAS